MSIELEHTAEWAKEGGASGYGGVWIAETADDPVFPLRIAAERTSKGELGTGIAVAFARNPMTTAMQANDLQLASKGRFLLGLGSQIKPHIEKRFSMPWSHPAPRMRAFVLAIRAIWESWNTGAKLSFEGEFYRHTLMTPFFSPGPNPHGAPKVFLAGVGIHMTEVAGEVCDGFLVHPFTTERYLKEVTMPALQRGMEEGGRARTDGTFRQEDQALPRLEVDRPTILGQLYVRHAHRRRGIRVDNRRKRVRDQAVRHPRPPVRPGSV